MFVYLSNSINFNCQTVKKNMKSIFILSIGCLLCGSLKAQHQQLFDEYCREAGDQAELFVGKIETGYPSMIYTNHPYWSSQDYCTGEVVYQGMLYKNVSLRYDAYLKQLVVNTPIKRSNVYVPMDRVERFKLEGTEYARRNGEFVAILFSSPRMELVEQVQIALKEQLVDNEKVKREFKREVKYYLLRAGQTHEVSKLKTVMKLFPGRGKTLKSFAKMHHLDFGVFRQSSLTTLVKYADELVQQPLNE